MKKIKLLSIFLLLCVLIFNLFAPACGSYDVNNAASNSSSITPYEPVTDNFENDRVSVTIKAEYSQVNKLWYPEDFQLEGIGISEIIDSTYCEDPSSFPSSSSFTQNLKLILSEPSKETVISAIHQIEVLPFVKRAQPVYIYGVVFNNTPNDIYYTLQWGLNEAQGSFVEPVWNFTTGDVSPRIKVGIFEGNLQDTHLDLRTADGNFTPSESTDSTHGTHVAGIIGAISNNTFGISGIAQVEIVLLNANDFANSVRWAARNNIKVINASFYYTLQDMVTPAPSNPDDFEALREFSGSGGIFIAAAGNDGTLEKGNTDNTPIFPAGYADSRYYPELNNVISVGSINESGARSTFSNYGANSVNVYAPGENILSTYPTSFCTECDYVFYDETKACEMDFSLIQELRDFIETYNLTWEFVDEHFSEIVLSYDGRLLEPNDFMTSPHYSNGYHYMSGTSMAAPHVTGVAALLLSYNPDLTAAQLKTAITYGSDTITISTPSGEQLVKKLNAFKALKYVMRYYGKNTTLKFNDKTLSKEVDSNSAYFNKSHYMLALDVDNAYTYDFSVSSTNAMEIILYNENLEELSISPMSTNAGCQLDFSYYLSQGTYFLQTTYIDETASGTISVTIRGEPHTHLYTHQYKSYNSTYHRAICACGEHTLQPHIARVNDGNPIRRCIICNAIISNGGSLTLNALQAQYVTINGSFIAPNGIIYLVDEDLDAYFEGTLVFFFKQPITSNTVQIYGEGLFIS